MSQNSEAPRYISQPELAELLTNKSTSQTTAVVDCRDEDRNEGGWVRGSIHFPSKRATPDAYAQLFASLTQSGMKRVVFHCMHSQVRGPTGARKFVTMFPAQARNGLEVLILEGGIQGFFRWADANHRMELVERTSQCFL
ncbi:rhodanese-like protein, putative [Bodo saltans]|uniref:Rhodanese-like protein, putative n=1 Tax=Bodo saltans TaxID=75058 RepID=A0A0S4IHU2_BODSA|nr:rhodanese-like protein, putative [Bodo saltans]|eukprot:CUE69024.1 rhodanese-like protein, putative [Bodo saltans]